MKSISYEDYVQLLDSLSEDPYDQDDQSYDDVVWMPSESSAKERMLAAREQKNGRVNVTKYRKSDIQEALYKTKSVAVDSFLLRINSYHGYPSPKEANLSMDITLWETHYKTPSGGPCKMEYRLNPALDKRFANCKWLHYFQESSARNVPTETVVEIVRWLQALKRMNAFL